MKKINSKKLTSVVLAVSMLFSVLSVGTFTAFAGDTLTVTTADQLTEALNKKSVVDAINITADITVTTDCSIQFDSEHIDYYSNTVMTVAEGVTLTIGNGGVIGSNWPSFEGDWNTPPTPNGKVINNGSIVIEDGGKTDADFDTNNGDILVKSGGNAVCCNENNGTITLEDNALYCTSQGQNSINKGRIVVHEGAFVEASMGSTIINEANGTIQLDGDFFCGTMGINNNDVLLFQNNGTVTGRGSTYVFQLDPQKLPVSNMDGMIEQMMNELGQTSRFENWEDVNIFRLEKVNSFDEIKALITGNRVVAGERVEGDMDIVVDIRSDITIPAGENIGTMALVVTRPWTTLTVASGASLGCGMENDGTTVVETGGKLATTMGGAIINTNTLVINEGAELKSHMGGEVKNEKGATLTLDGTFYCGCIGMGNKDVAWFENDGTVSGNGGIVLYQAAPDEMPVSNIAALGDAVNQNIADNGGTIAKVEAHTDHTWNAGEVTKPATATAAGVKTYTCTICGAAKEETIPKTATVKKNNPIVAKGKTVKLSLAKLKKKSLAVKRAKAVAISNAQGAVTYSKVKGNKKITVAKNGKITVKKGIKKGTYKIKIKVMAAGNSAYKSAVKTVTVKIVVQ